MLDPQAQFELAGRYETGKRVTKSPEKAQALYKSAAHAGAQNLLASRLHHQGKPSQADLQAALAWALQAAEQEEPEALAQLADT